MRTEDPFRSVLLAAQVGDEWAWAELYRRYNPLLGRYFAAHSPSVAEDLAAETWLGAARGLPGFEGDEIAFRSWLFTIAHRRLADHWKARSRAGGEPAGPDDLDSLPAPDAPEADVVDALSGRAAAARIAAALPADQAEVVLLRVVAGLDVDQVAAIVGRRPGHVRVLQHRALKKLGRVFSLEAVTE